ncbi:MAG TPA: hypothetical protein VGZ69_00585 [Candidatus Rhabdochlamydia sp.]|jgi:hypothetical protein|nr:hypothetical protein [Candidatus Rhabdochlamydia sp.]
MTQITVQGTLDLSNNRLTLNFDGSLLNNQNHFALSQQSNNQESFTPLPQQPSSRQFPIIRKPSMHFYTSALGLAGGIGLVVSCIWSVLLPAIGSVGVMTFAYLANRKITPLNAKELSSATAKSQSVFAQRSQSLLDEPNANIATLAQPMSPMSNGTNQPNIPPPPPLPGSGNLLDGLPIDAGNLPPPILPTSNGNRPNVLLAPPPPPPTAPPLAQKGVKNPSTSEDPKEALLSSIRNSFNCMQVKELIKQDPGKYPSNLLLKELKTTYERALDISEKSERFKKDWKGYFKGKVDSFEKNFGIAEQGGNQTTEEMEDVCEKASCLDSLLKNMNWAKSLLQILSEREDLSDKARKHCSEKLENIDEHIKKLQRRNEKKSEEAASTSTQETSALEIKKDLGIESILARRVVHEYSDSSGSESEPGEDDWD